MTDWGLLAEFDNAERLVAAARQTREAGYRRFESLTPFPVPELSEPDGGDDWVDWAATAGSVLAGGGALILIVWLNAVDYPINIGGRPLLAWPAFAFPAFELGTLGGVIAAFLVMVLRNRLPDLRHPVLSNRTFQLESTDRFFLCIERADPLYGEERTRAFLEGLGATKVVRIEHGAA